MSDPQEHLDELGPKVESGVERITAKKLWKHVADQFLLHSGLLHTIRELALRPDQVVRGYLFTEDGREKLSNPISFLLITLIPVIFLLSQFHGFEQMSNFNVQFGGNEEDTTASIDSSPQLVDTEQSDSLLAALAASIKPDSALSQTEDSLPSEELATDAAIYDSIGQVNPSEHESQSEPFEDDRSAAISEHQQEFMDQWGAVFKRYYNLFSMGSIPIYALFTWLLFRGGRFLYTEHIIANAYIAGFQNVLFIPFAPWAFSNHIVLAISSLLNWAYFVWVFHRLFRNQEKQTIVRGIGAQALGVTSYGCLMVIVVVVLMFAFLMRIFQAGG